MSQTWKPAPQGVSLRSGFWETKEPLHAKSTCANKNEICSQSCTFKRTTIHGKTNAEPQQVEGSLQLWMQLGETPRLHRPSLSLSPQTGHAFLSHERSPRSSPTAMDTRMVSRMFQWMEAFLDGSSDGLDGGCRSPAPDLQVRKHTHGPCRYLWGLVNKGCTYLLVLPFLLGCSMRSYGLECSSPSLKHSKND